MTSPTLAADHRHTLGTGSSFTETSSAVSTGDILLVALGTRTGAGSGVVLASAISATGFSSFHRLTSVSYGSAPGEFSTQDLGMDIWWASATANSAGQTINITMSSSAQVEYVDAVVRGVYDVTSPFDTNASETAFANGTTTVTYTTIQPDDLLLFVAFSNSASGSGGPGGAWTTAIGAAGDPDTRLDYLSVSSVQTMQTAATTGAWGHVAAVVAATADRKGGLVLQTFVTCFN